MKSGVIAVVAAGLVVATGITYAFIRDLGTAVAEEPSVSVSPVPGPQPSTTTVHVEDLAAHPETFTGDIVLRAVVAGVKQSEGVFGVIDSREFEECGVLSCAKTYLPVKFSGELPEPRTVVEVTGQVVQGNNGLVFDAKRLDPVR